MREVPDVVVKALRGKRAESQSRLSRAPASSRTVMSSMMNGSSALYAYGKGGSEAGKLRLRKGSPQASPAQVPLRRVSGAARALARVPRVIRTLRSIVSERKGAIQARLRESE